MNENLSDKQEAFCREYLIDFNATKAAIRAGYSENSAKEQGYRLLTKDHISSRISRLAENVVKDHSVTIERIIQEYANIAFLDPIDIFDENGKLKPLDEMSENARRAISGIKIRVERCRGDENEFADITEVKIIDKRQALSDLGKHLGMFIDRIDHTTAGEKITQPSIVFSQPKAGDE